MAVTLGSVTVDNIKSDAKIVKGIGGIQEKLNGIGDDKAGRFEKYMSRAYLREILLNKFLRDNVKKDEFVKRLKSEIPDEIKVDNIIRSLVANKRNDELFEVDEKLIDSFVSMPEERPSQPTRLPERAEAKNEEVREFASIRRYGREVLDGLMKQLMADNALIVNLEKQQSSRRVELQGCTISNKNQTNRITQLKGEIQHHDELIKQLTVRACVTERLIENLKVFNSDAVDLLKVQEELKHLSIGEAIEVYSYTSGEETASLDESHAEALLENTSLNLDILFITGNDPLGMCAAAANMAVNTVASTMSMFNPFGKQPSALPQQGKTIPEFLGLVQEKVINETPGDPESSSTPSNNTRS